MHIIHISDLHFGNSHSSFSVKELESWLTSLVNKYDKQDLYLVLSGDVTLRGNKQGYVEAEQFIKKVWLDNEGSRENFIVCPGNHDICDQSFDEFDKFCYGITRSVEPKFNNRNASLIYRNHDQIAFLLINTAYHKDHTYGQVDLDEIKKILDRNSESLKNVSQKIVVLHHHLISVDVNDLSTLRNALPLLKLLDTYKFNLILHGHRHAISSLCIGDSGIYISSARSLNFDTKGYVNGCTILKFNGSIWEVEQSVFSKDSPAPISCI